MDANTVKKRKPKRAPQFRAASFGDYEQIDQLGARYGLKPKPYEEWANLWLGNPAYQEVRDRWDIGWVLTDEQGRIGASVGNIPIWYDFQGERLLAASSHAWVADPEYRSASLLLLDHLINQPGTDLFITTTLSALSTPGVSTFECHRVPVGVWDQSAFWITGYRGFMKSWLRLKRLPTAAPLSYPLATAAWLKEQLLGKPLRPGDAEVQGCSGFDERFEDFWLELRRANPHFLLAVRARQVMEWHYKFLLQDERLWIASVVENARMVAYAVFDRSDKPAIGLTRVRLVDFQSLDGSAALLPPLLSWALTRCRAEGIHVLEYFGRWLEKGELVDRIAPYRRNLPTWIFVYRASDPTLAARLRDPRAWTPTLYDGDASLVR